MKKTYVKQRSFQSFLLNEESYFLDNEKVIKCGLPSKIEFMIRNLYQRGDSQFKSFVDSSSFNSD